MPSQLATGLRVCLSAWCAVCLVRSAWLVCLFVCLFARRLAELWAVSAVSPGRGRFSRLCRSLGIAFCSSLVHYVPYCTYRGALADREPNVLANRGLPCVTGVTAAHAGVVFGVVFGVHARTPSQTLTCRHKRAHPHPHTHQHAHEPWARVRASSGVPRCHDCHSPKVSSEPRNPRKRNRRKGDGRHGRLLNGHRMPLTSPRSGH